MSSYPNIKPIIGTGNLSTDDSVGLGFRKYNSSIGEIIVTGSTSGNTLTLVKYSGGTIEIPISSEQNLDGYIPFISKNYIVINASGTTIENGNSLRNAINDISLFTPNGNSLSATNQVDILLLPGTYDLGSVGIIKSEFINIKGLGSTETVIITSSASDYTIQLSGSSEYRFESLTIDNTSAGYSISYDTTTNDFGNYKNLIISAPTDPIIIWNGNYDNIIATVDYVFNGSILGNVINSNFKNNSCGYVENGVPLIISGIINNCFGGNKCFGSAATNESINFTGKILNCSGGNYSFISTTAGNFDIYGIIDNCNSTDYSFGFCAGGHKTTTLQSTGKILNSNVFGGSSFMASFGTDDMNVNGIIDNCTSIGYSFGYSMNCNIISNVYSIIKNCTSGPFSFASCEGNGSVTLNGIIDNCNGGDNGSISSSFGFSSNGNVTINNYSKILNCTSSYNSNFGCSYGGNVIIDGLIEGCFGGSNRVPNNYGGGNFGYSQNGNVTITSNGIIKNCISDGRSSFGARTLYIGNVIIDGTFENCTSLGNSFGSGGSEPSGPGISINGFINNCTVLNKYGFNGDYSFGAAASGPVFIGGTIKNCIANDYSFGSSSAGNIYITGGTISNCVASQYSFGCSNNQSNNNIIVNISSIIDNCKSNSYSFGYINSGSTIISGIISNCFGNDYCFGSTTGINSTVLISGGTILNSIANLKSFGNSTTASTLNNCIRNGDYGIHSANIIQCKFSSISFPALTIGNNAKISYSTFKADGIGNDIESVSSINASIYFTSMRIGFNTGNITNLIGTPNNVINSNI